MSTLRASFGRPSIGFSRQAPLILLLGAGTGVLVAALPTFSLQIALLGGAVDLAIVLVMARFGRTINASWVLVASIFLVGPVGALLLRAGIGLSVVAAIVGGFLPFAIAAFVLHREARPRLALLAPLILLLAFGAASLAWSPDAAYGAEKLTVWILASLIPVAFILVLVPASPVIDWRPVAVAAVITALAMIAFGVASPTYPGRPTLFDANPIWESRALFIGAIVVTFAPIPRWMKLLLIPLVVYAAILPVSRGPAIGFVLGACAGGAEKLRTFDRHDRRIQLAWAGIGIVTALAIVAGLGLFDRVSSLLTTFLAEPDVTSRASYINESGRLFWSHPFLGVGLGGFAATGMDDYPHNLGFELAAELGVLGVLLVVPWVAFAVRGAAGSPMLMALLVSTGIFTLFSGSLASNVEFWLCSAFAVARFPLGRRRVQARTQAFARGQLARG
ncbi:MAG: O-antigen ligase family protein [Chloroflexota bacterium]|nr:O-antigen ligase family protein [Chloroflexota bacterium]